MARSLENLQKQYNSAASSTMGRGPGGPGGPGRGPGRGPGGGGGRMSATNGFKGKPANTKATILRIFSYVARYWKRLILVFMCMILSTAATLAGSYMLRPIINHIAEAGIPAAERVAYLGGMLGVLAGVYAVGILGTYLQSRLMIGISRTAIMNIRNDLFTKLERLPLRFHDNHPTGELMSRFTNDVDNIGLMMDQSLMSMVSGIINLVGTLVMMIVTNIWLTVITLVFIPIFVTSSRLIISKSRKYYSAQQAALGAANGYIEESVAGQKVVKVFNHEEECIEEFGLLNGDLRGKQMKAMFFGSIMGPISGNLAQISYALTAGIGTSNSSGQDTDFFKQVKTNISNSIGLTVSVPLFDNLQARTNIRKAKYSLQNNELALQEQQKKLYSTVEQYWLNATTSQQQYLYAKANVKSMQESYDLVSEQFSLGLKNIVELTTGKNNLLQAQQQLLQTKYTALLNEAMLNFYAGENIQL